MKRLLTVVLLLLYCATANSSDTRRIEGQVFDCAGSTVFPVKRIDVFVFRKTQDVELGQRLVQLDELARTQQMDRFIAAYNRFEVSVRSKKKWVVQTKSNEQGRFALTVPSALDDLEILVISFTVEDELSYYAHQPIGMSGTPVKIWMAAECSVH